MSTNDKMFSTAIMVICCFLALMVIGIVALSISNSKTQQEIHQQQQEAFYSKCAIACAPNAVYSIDHGCKCNAIVTVREIQ